MKKYELNKEALSNMNRLITKLTQIKKTRIRCVILLNKVGCKGNNKTA